MQRVSYNLYDVVLGGAVDRQPEPVVLQEIILERHAARRGSSPATLHIKVSNALQVRMWLAQDAEGVETQARVIGVVEEECTVLVRREEDNVSRAFFAFRLVFGEFSPLTCAKIGLGYGWVHGWLVGLEGKHIASKPNCSFFSRHFHA